MTISSRTPEGLPHRCPVCGNTAALEPCYPGGDAVCPACGSLLWQCRDCLSKATGIPLEQIELDSLWRDDLGVDSLDLVEAVMALEEQLRITIPDSVAEQLHSLRDVIEYLRRQQDAA